MTDKKAPFTDKDIALLQRWLDTATKSLNSDYEYWCHHCKKSGMEHETMEEYLQTFEEESIADGMDEKEARWHVENATDLILLILTEGRQPWSTVHRDDVFGILHPLLKQWPLPSANDLLNTVFSQMPKRYLPCGVLLEYRLSRQALLSIPVFPFIDPTGREITPNPTLKDELPILVRLDNERGVKEIHVRLSNGSLKSGLVVEVKGTCTRLASPMFAAAIRDIIAQCFSLSAKDRYDKKEGAAWFSHDYRPKDQAYPLSEVDGIKTIKFQAFKDDPGFFQLTEEGPNGIGREGALRLKYLFRIVFQPEGALVSEQENVLRTAVWSMAETMRLGASPLSFLSYMAIAESCLKVLLQHNEAEHGKFWPYLPGRLELPNAAQTLVSNLKDKRNDVAHNVAYGIQGRLVLTAFRLAWSSAHHLLAKLSNTEKLATGATRYNLKDTLRNILLWDLE